MAFDERRFEEPESPRGLRIVIPSDTQMRTILDEVLPIHIRRPFRSIFHQLQRGKVLPRMTCLDGHLLLAIDGTGVYSSENIGSDYCLTKKKRNGKTEYHLQMVKPLFHQTNASNMPGTHPAAGRCHQERPVRLFVIYVGASEDYCHRGWLKRQRAAHKRFNAMIFATFFLSGSCLPVRPCR